jgi:hypothetical protein
MDETVKVEFYAEINADNATDEELDRLTRQLLSELRGLDSVGLLAREFRMPEDIYWGVILARLQVGPSAGQLADSLVELFWDGK